MNDELRQQLLRLAADDQEHARAVFEASQRHEPHRGRFLFDIPRDEWLPEYVEAERAAVGRTAAFKALLEDQGWPGASVAGEDGCRAAWLLAQHAGKVDPDLQRRSEALLADAVARGDARPGQLAALRDRIELEAGRPQRYGSHLEPDGAGWKAVRGLVDVRAVDERRAELGLTPWAEYVSNCERGITET